MHGLAEKQLFSWSQAFYRVEINKLNSTQLMIVTMIYVFQWYVIYG